MGDLSNTVFGAKDGQIPISINLPRSGKNLAIAYN